MGVAFFGGACRVGWSIEGVLCEATHIAWSGTLFVRCAFMCVGDGLKGMSWTCYSLGHLLVGKLATLVFFAWLEHVACGGKFCMR